MTTPPYVQVDPQEIHKLFEAIDDGADGLVMFNRFYAPDIDIERMTVLEPGEVLTAVRKAWLDVYLAEQATELVTESRPFFVDLVTIARSLYGVGRKSQHDVLRAELEPVLLERLARRANGELRVRLHPGRELHGSAAHGRRLHAGGGRRRIGEGT